MELKDMNDESPNDVYNSGDNPPMSTDIDISMAVKKIALNTHTELCDVVKNTFEDINDTISLEEVKTSSGDVSFLENRKNATNQLDELKTQLLNANVEPNVKFKIRIRNDLFPTATNVEPNVKFKIRIRNDLYPTAK